MRGRAKGNQERIIVLAHQVEAMARQKVLKPLAKYLEPPKNAKPKDGAQALLERLRKIKAKQDGRGSGADEAAT